MARSYGKILCCLWVSSAKWRSLAKDNEARLLYLYLHTNTHASIVLTYVLPEAYALADLGWTEKAYRKAMESLSKALLIVYDEGESVVHLPGAVENDPPTNKNHCRAMVSAWKLLPDCRCKWMSYLELSAAKHFPEEEKTEIPEAYPLDTLSIAYRKDGYGIGSVEVVVVDVPQSSKSTPLPPPDWCQPILDDWVSIKPLMSRTKPEQCLDAFAKLHTDCGYSPEKIAEVTAWVVRNKVPTYIRSPTKFLKDNGDGDAQTFEMYVAMMESSGKAKADTDSRDYLRETAQ